MGTHPIFESDFDCLTDACFVLKLKKCVTSLPIFSLNSVVTMPQMLMPSRLFSEALVSMLTKRNSEKSSTKFLPKVKANSPPSHPVVEPLPQLPVAPLVVLLKRPRKKPRRNPHPRAKTKIWDSVFSIKTEDDSYRHLFATVRHLFVLHVS